MDDAYGNEPSLVYEEPPPYSPVRSNRSNDFLDEKKDDGKDDGIVVRIARAWTKTATIHVAPKRITRTMSDFLQQRTWPAIRDTTTTHVTPVLSSSTRTTWKFIQERIWQAIKDYPLKLTQVWAVLLLCLGIVPFATFGMLVQGGPETFYYGAFAAKTLGCGDSLGQPQNSTVEGVEALFVLDWTFGTFSFARVKTIDVAWDIVVGRGVQGVFWAICYRVFTDALLRLIERHPASYEAFKSISLEGAGLGSCWILAKQLFRNRSKRTWFLFFYLLLSSFYVLSIPPLLGAMTGYDGTTIAWVSIGDADNIIPSAQLEQSYIVYGTWNQSFDEPLCDTTTAELRDWFYHQQDMSMYCDCQLPNKTILPYQGWQQYYNSLTYSNKLDATSYKLDDCNMNFPNNSKWYTPTWGQYSGYERANTWETLNCNDTFPVTLPNHKTYSIYDLNFTQYGYCFQNKAYDYSALQNTMRCLPDTAHPSYQWGFSSAMMGVLFIINFVWCLTMWVVWQDAMFAKLVRQGYRMSSLRAAFVLTEAARRRTGVGGEGLVLRERRMLKRELKRGKGQRDAVINKMIFEETSRETETEVPNHRATVRRRPVESKNVDNLDAV